MKRICMALIAACALTMVAKPVAAHGPRYSVFIGATPFYPYRPYYSPLYYPPPPRYYYPGPPYAVFPAPPVAAYYPYPSTFGFYYGR
ncbi:MAG TPA: hypothetical protein VL175_17900 [Pirellulales bacterium]|jgi:hypothetical protein|nr:hypothetical protein [Pirellulales bacterium]